MMPASSPMRQCRLSAPAGRIDSLSAPLGTPAVPASAIEGRTGPRPSAELPKDRLEFKNVTISQGHCD